MRQATGNAPIADGSVTQMEGVVGEDEATKEYLCNLWTWSSIVDKAVGGKMPYRQGVLSCAIGEATRKWCLVGRVCCLVPQVRLSQGMAK